MGIFMTAGFALAALLLAVECVLSDWPAAPWFRVALSSLGLGLFALIVYQFF